MKYKQIIIYICTIIFSVLFIYIGSNMCKSEITGNKVEEVDSAKVLSIIDVVEEKFDSDYTEEKYVNKTIKFKAQITNGKNKDVIIEASQMIDKTLNAYQTKEVKVNDSILVGIDTSSEDSTNEESKWIFMSFNRLNTLIFLIILFLVIIILIGKKKGINTIISLMFTCLAIFTIYIPSILKGYNIYISTSIIAIFVIVMSLLIINGANKKTLAAILGNLGGVILAALLALLMNKILDITGVIDQDYIFLTMINEGNPLDLIAIVWGGIVIGSLGAIMDVAMSIASSINELSEHMENKSFIKLLKSGMNIGKDAIGTMTNTLILAYIGSSLATVLLLIGYNRDALYLLNMEMIIVEVLQGIVGSIGILIAVPITAVVSAYIFNKNK